MINPMNEEQQRIENGEMLWSTGDEVDLAQLQRDTMRALERYPFGQNMQICLTHRADVTDPVERGYEGTGGLTEGCTEFDYNIFNEEFKDTYFHQIYEYCAQYWKVGRMRLMLCPPRHCYSMHRDDTVRQHIAVFTNPHCFIVFSKGHVFHLPEDGQVYQMVGWELHSAMSGGDSNRIHFVYELDDL